MAERRWWRSSLVLRLLAVSVVVSVLSIAATAWLAVRTTTKAIQQERGQALIDDTKIYDALLGYAATHRDWGAADPLVRSLAASTGRRIVVTRLDRTPLISSGSASGALPARASATVDPLAVDSVASPGSIDPRVVGPFQLLAKERQALDRLAGAVLDCLRGPTAAVVDVPHEFDRVVPAAAQAEIVREPNGRPRVSSSDGDSAPCTGQLQGLSKPTATEDRALRQLDKLTNACLTRQRLAPIAVSLGGGWVTANPTGQDSTYREAVESCLTAARRVQLADYVPPAALLFILEPGDLAPAGGFDLSPTNRARIVGVTGLILLVAIGVTAVVGLRLVRPLHALTAAAGRMRDGDVATRVTVAGHDEIARLGGAFNAMAEQRHHVEMLRRAMVGDIAHEMRSPVTNIRGWLEAAHDGVVPLDKELVTSLLEEAVLLQHVIEDLQDLSAADAGELRLHPQPVDVPELLRAVADAFTQVAAGVALVVSADGVGSCTADPIRLRQALGNLVANAIRHTPAGGSVTLRARTEGAELVIDVVDTGPGIPESQQALVFERFWRAESSRSRATGGSGLGLSIVRKLAEAHGGSVSLSSTPGHGATFTLRLPYDSAGAPPFPTDRERSG
ncbi:sensor histidine kinase [Micromonospora sp. NPDC051925]|uniref:sensor histidine kinase n=1 Tax=Micromonospora sp. NPDC051925 TaxID=3364288 RepID=UPI0037C694BC